MKRQRRGSNATSRKKQKTGSTMAALNRAGALLGIENKYYDVSLSNSALTAPINATGGEHDPSATLSLNTVAQGDTESNRDGKKILMQKLILHGNIFVPAQANRTSGLQPGIAYVAVVLDTQCNGAKLNSEDVFKNQAGSSRLAAQPLRNLQYSTRFRVLASKRITLTSPEATYDGTNIEADGTDHPFDFYVNLKNLPVTFTGTTSDVASISDNCISVVAYCTSTDFAPALYYQSRLRFAA